MSLTPLPDLDPGALVSADLAYLEEPSGTPTSDRVQRAIAAYLWHLENQRPLTPGSSLIVGPSLSEYRAARSGDQP